MPDFTTVASADAFDEEDGTVVEVDGEEIAVFKTEGEFYAIGNTCTHTGGPLGKGEVDDTTVTCPWHGSDFDVTSGECLSPPADDPVPEYEVEVEDSEVKIAV
jgi:nitrite reductase/ring-hydroxylating ferredoxin subunit